MGKPRASASTLSPGLARRIASEVAGKNESMKVQAHEDISLVKRRRAEISDAFYEIGEALVRLKDVGAKAAGYSTFADLCEAELDISVAKAEQLISLASRLRRSDAVRLGQERALALLDLCDATPRDDTPRTLETARITLPDGSILHVARASTREIRGAAKAIRAAVREGKARGRGRTTTKAERDVAKRIEAQLRARGVTGVTVAALATKAGQPGKLRIDGVRVEDLWKLRAVLPPR